MFANIHDVDFKLINFLTIKTLKKIFLINANIHKLISKIENIKKLKHSDKKFYERGYLNLIQLCFNDYWYDINDNYFALIISNSHLKILHYLSKLNVVPKDPSSVITTVKYDDIETVKYMLTNFSLNEKSIKTLFIYCCNIDIIDYLFVNYISKISTSNEVSLNCQATLTNALLSNINYNDNTKIIKYLYKVGADINYYKCIENACEFGYFKIIKFLYKNNVKITNNCIIKLLSFNYEEKIVKIFKYFVKQKINLCFSNNILVIKASGKGYIRVVKYLILIGADCTDQNNLAIKKALKENKKDMVAYLKNNGASLV